MTTAGARAGTAQDWLAAAIRECPAVVLQAPGNRREACVWHPLGDDHPHAIATRERLRRRGYQIVPFPRSPDHA